MAIENAKFGKGIALAGGFDLGAKAPLDSRLTVATIEERDAHVEGNRAYDGMLVFVEANKITYQYILGEDGTGEWKEFGFNEADFVAHVANDLVTDDEAKALSAAQGVVLKGLIDGEIERAGEAEEGLQAAIDEVAELVGELPEGTSAKTIREYVDLKTSGIATDVALEELNNQVSGLQTSVQEIKGDYLKEEDKTELSNAIAGEAELARAAEKANADAIKAISDNYLKSTDKEELQGNIDEVATAVELLTNGVSAEEVDGVNDLIQYVKDHGTEVTGMKDGIAENKAAIEAEVKRSTEKDTALEEAIATKAEAQALTDEIAAREGAVSGLDERLLAVEAQLGDGEGSVTEQIDDAKEAAVTEAVEQAAADAETKANKALDDAKTHTAEKIAEEVTARDAAIATAKEEALAGAETKAKELDAALEETLKAYADSKVSGVDLTGIAKNAEDIVALQEAMELKADASEVNGKIEALEDEVAKIGTIEDGKTVVELLAEARVALENADTQVEANAKNYTNQEIDKVKATIGEVAENKTVLQLIQEAREAAIASATYDDTKVKADIAKNTEDIAKNASDIAALAQTHATDKDLLSAKDTEIEGNVSGLQERIVALESIDYVEISNQEINAMFPTEA